MISGKCSPPTTPSPQRLTRESAELRVMNAHTMTAVKRNRVPLPRLEPMDESSSIDVSTNGTRETTMAAASGRYTRSSQRQSSEKPTDRGTRANAASTHNTAHLRPRATSASLWASAAGASAATVAALAAWPGG